MTESQRRRVIKFTEVTIFVYEIDFGYQNIRLLDIKEMDSEQPSWKKEKYKHNHLLFLTYEVYDKKGKKITKYNEDIRYELYDLVMLENIEVEFLNRISCGFNNQPDI